MRDLITIVLINLFSGAAQLTLYDDLGKPINTDFIVSPFLTIGLGYFPLIFSILFFIIPIIRIFYVKRKNAKRENDIYRKKLVGAFVRNHTKSITLPEIMSIAHIDKKYEEKTKNILEKLVIELRGEINIDTMGNPIYSFKRLSAELGIN